MSDVLLVVKQLDEMDIEAYLLMWDAILNFPPAQYIAAEFVNCKEDGECDE